MMRRHHASTLALALFCVKAFAFNVQYNQVFSIRPSCGQRCRPLYSDADDYNDNVYDPNRWISTDEQESLADGSWEETLARREDGSLWSSFESSDDDSEISASASDSSSVDIDDGEEAWLDSLQNIAAEEINFMTKEADRADKARQMEEMGFSSESISATLGVAVDEDLESDKENPLFEAFKEETAKTGFGQVVDDDIDMETVESHSQVEWDEEADEPVRSQHVYVDEVTCIGCTNCAMIAGSTFFMEGEHGRARVFQQWGDDDETIAVAIQTCPVDCIHYVPYDELKRLEIERRKQNINFKARYVITLSCITSLPMFPFSCCGFDLDLSIKEKRVVPATKQSMVEELSSLINKSYQAIWVHDATTVQAAVARTALCLELGRIQISSRRRRRARRGLQGQR